MGMIAAGTSKADDCLSVLPPTCSRVSNGLTVKFSLGGDDLILVKALRNLFSGDEDSYVNLFNSEFECFIKDMNGNKVASHVPASIDDGNGVMMYNNVKAGSYNRDDTNPIFMDFTVEMEYGHITLSFDEAVHTPSFDPREITLVNQADTCDASGANCASDRDDTTEYVTTAIFTHRLTGGTIVHIADDLRSFTFKLIDEDKRQLKLKEPLWKAEASTYLAMTEETIEDASGNAVVPQPLDNAKQTSDLNFDGEIPELLQFDLDMDYSSTRALLTMRFSDVVVVQNTLEITRIVIQSMQITDRASGTGQEDGASAPTALWHRLTGTVTQDAATRTTSEHLCTSHDGYSLEIELSYEDTNAIKLKSGLAITDATTWITVDEGTVLDDRQLRLKSIANDAGEAMPVTKYDADVTDPELWAFSLDMTNEILKLTFSETVKASRFTQQGLTLQGASAVGTDLGDGLTGVDNPTQLLNGVQSTDDSTVVTVTIPTVELDAIKKKMELASRVDNTYISMLASTIQDMSQNQVGEIFNSNAQLANEYMEDTTDPNLMAYSFNVHGSSGVLTLTFDETVKASTLDETQITFQSHDGTTGQALESHTLNGKDASTQVDSTVVEITLLISDTNEIKRLKTLAVGEDSTYISFGAQLISDMNVYDAAVLALPQAVPRLNRQNMVAEVLASAAKRVAVGVTWVDNAQKTNSADGVFTNDLAPPTLLEFDFNFETEMITFVFLETISRSSLLPNSITLFSGDPSGITDPANFFKLSGGVTQDQTVDSTVVQLKLVFDDLNEIKSRTSLAEVPSAMHLKFDDDGILDMRANGIVSASHSVAVSCSGTDDCPYSPTVTLTSDVTPPTLEQADLNMDTTSAVLTLRFSETVNVGTFD
eukprot:gene14074-34822_t